MHLREKTLYRMLFETAGRADGILGVNIEDLDFAGRGCQVKAKGTKAKSRRRGQAREDFALETVYWDAGTARLLSRLLKGRNRGPVFVTHRRAGPGKIVSPRDVCPDTGFARLSYGQARALLAEHTAVRGPGAGWYLHEYRHSSLTHLGEQGASLLMLMAKSPHKKPENVRRYFKPSPEPPPSSPACLRRVTADAESPGSQRQAVRAGLSTSWHHWRKLVGPAVCGARCSAS